MRAIEAVTTPGESEALCQWVDVSTQASLYRGADRPAFRPRTTVGFVATVGRNQLWVSDFER